MLKARWRKWMMGTVAGLAAGCSGNTVTPDPLPIQNRAELLTFSGNHACQELELYLEDTAVSQMRTQLEAARDQVPSWGWWGGGWEGRGGLDLAGGPPNAQSAGGADRRAAGEDR